MALAVESFVLCVLKCDVEVVEDILLDTTVAHNQQRNQRPLPVGYLAKVKQMHESHKTCLIRIYDFYSRNLAFENNLFACAVASLREVEAPLWPFLVALPEPVDRVQLFRDPELVAYLLGLRIDDLGLVKNSRYPASSSSSYLTCIIRHIGLVSEIGDGYYLGVEITVILGGFCVFVK